MAKLHQLASPKYNRVKSKLLAVPSSRAFRLLIALPVCSYLGLRTANYFARKYLIYADDSASDTPSPGTGGGDPTDGKHWYQVSKVKGVEGTYSLLGFEFRSPQMVLVTWVRNYMGGVIKEVLADEQVNKEGLNFLDRAFRHP